MLASAPLASHWQSGDGLANFDFDRIKASLLLVHHAQDTCPPTPYAAALALTGRYPLKTVKDAEASRIFASSSGSAHHFAGHEAETVDGILDWVRRSRWPDGR